MWYWEIDELPLSMSQKLHTHTDEPNKSKAIHAFGTPREWISRCFISFMIQTHIIDSQLIETVANNFHTLEKRTINLIKCRCCALFQLFFLLFISNLLLLSLISPSLSHAAFSILKWLWKFCIEKHKPSYLYDQHKVMINGAMFIAIGSNAKQIIKQKIRGSCEWSCK